MKGQPKLIAEKIAALLREWPCVDSIITGHLLSGDFSDPYYFLSLDVYVSGALPDSEERKKNLGFGVAFESSISKDKDRLLIDEIPVRIEYKPMDRVNVLLDFTDGREDFLARLRGTGTYVFYKIINSDVFYDRGGWIAGLRKKLKNMPASFWEALRSSYQSRMEHCLSDLGAAAMRSDELFFLISSANFLQCVCSVLFAVNKRFEPSFRLFSEQVKALPVLPESFAGRFDTLLRTNVDFPQARKYGIAELLAKSLLSL